MNHVSKRNYFSRHRIHFVPLSSANCAALLAHSDRRTAWGAWLSANQGLIWVLFTLIFVISLVGAFRWLVNPSNQACEIPLAAPMSEESRHEQLL